METAAIVPCYRVAKAIRSVIEAIPERVDHIILVDDKCPEGSGRIAQSVADPRLKVVFHDENRGVGGAVVTGYRLALEMGYDIMVKIDGDGQMDPAHIGRLVSPIEGELADYTKGNRFAEFSSLGTMPKIRLLGNSMLSFMIKCASGYWDLIDPTNGYTAIHRRALERLDLGKISKRYFFETDMLIRLNTINAVVQDVPIPAKYGDETSSLNVGKCLLGFPPKILKGLFRRVFLKYFIYDFNMASVYLIFGIPMLAFGIGKGITEWIHSVQTGIPRTTGTVMLVVLPIILGFQMLLQAISIDINSIPKKSPGNTKQSP